MGLTVPELGVGNLVLYRNLQKETDVDRVIMGFIWLATKWARLHFGPNASVQVYGKPEKVAIYAPVPMGSVADGPQCLCLSAFIMFDPKEVTPFWGRVLEKHDNYAVLSFVKLDDAKSFVAHD